VTTEEIAFSSEMQDGGARGVNGRGGANTPPILHAESFRNEERQERKKMEKAFKVDEQLHKVAYGHAGATVVQSHDWVYKNRKTNLEWIDGSDLDEDDDDDDDYDDDDFDDELEEEEEEEGEVTVNGSDVNLEKRKEQSYYCQQRTEIEAPRYLHWRDHFPFLQKLLMNTDALTKEMERLTEGRWCPWPELQLYSSEDQKGDWKVIPLMHTFPAYDQSKTQWIESNCAACPKTAEVLREIPGLRTALFSRLGPKTRLSSHRGWADLSNYVLRCHLPLFLPDQERFPESCGMWVEGDVQFHKLNDILVFDDSKLHKAFNASDEERIILIFDIMRPESVPLGMASGGHTEQLDEFIAEYQRGLGLLKKSSS